MSGASPVDTSIHRPARPHLRRLLAVLVVILAVLSVASFGVAAWYLSGEIGRGPSRWTSASPTTLPWSRSRTGG